MQVKLLNEDPYGSLICKYFAQTFPKVIVPNSKQLLDILTTILVGSKNVRYGPTPDVENLVEIRKVISRCIQNNEKIPVLVAWGGVKTQRDAAIDIAEVSAISQLIRLDDAIKQYYPKGLKIRIRIEDTGAEWIYREENISNSIRSYSESFSKLVRVLSGQDYDILAIKESSLMDLNTYFATSDTYANILERVITAQIISPEVDIHELEAFKYLKNMGWKGDIPEEQRDYYLERYASLYPDMPKHAHIRMLADYLGGAKARYELNGRANPSEEQFLNISFIPPIPGAPNSMFSTNLYYRTVPMTDGRTHIAPWRAKGYLEIANSNDIKAKITSWGNTSTIGDLIPLTVNIENKEIGEGVLVSADYFLSSIEIPIGMMG
jgi:hypothetical protein